MNTSKELILFAGNSNLELAEKIADHLNVKLGDIELSRFKDGEVSCQINENVRGNDVFIMQSTCRPVNDTLMELLIMLDAFKRASAGRITAVIPYFGYARQDRKERPRVPITAKLVADLLLTAGAGRVLTIDLHANQIQGFFDMPVDHLYAAMVMLSKVKDTGRSLVVVAPDAGGVERARAFAKRLDNSSMAIIDKRREVANVSKVMNIIGEVEGRDCVIVDDICDTAGTLTQSAKALVKEGARQVIACCSHAVLSPPAIERIEDSPLEKVFISDTIPLREEHRNCRKLEVVSVAGLLAKAIKNIHEESSVSTLFR